MKRKVLAIAAALLMAAAGIGAVSADVSAAEVKTSLSAGYRNKYKKLLAADEGFQGVYIGDLVGDGREELLIAENDLGLFTLYVPEGKKLLRYEFDVMSVWGYTKYIKDERSFICMNYYGHTQGAPYALKMETVAVNDGKFDRFRISRDQDEQAVINKINGKTVTAEEFSLSLNTLIAETARSEFIPLVRHGEDALKYYDGEVMDIGYDDYIREMLG